MAGGLGRRREESVGLLEKPRVKNPEAETGVFLIPAQGRCAHIYRCVGGT